MDEEQLKEKKKQRLMKAGYDARLRARAEKLKEREERAAEIKREEEERNRDPVKWASNLRQAHQVNDSTILTLIKRYAKDLSNKLRERKKRKAALNDRESAASQARMKNITSLASDERVGRKKRKVANGD